MKKLAFISYSREDEKVVGKLARDLRESGVPLWLDQEEIGVGDAIVEEIARGLSKCTHLIIVLSKNFAASPWCKAELRSILHRAIQDERKNVLPIVVSEIPRALWNNPPLIFVEGLRRLDFRRSRYKANLPLLLSALGTQPQAKVMSQESTIEEQIASFLDLHNLDQLRFTPRGIMQTMTCERIVVDRGQIGDNSLGFITEEQVHFRNWLCGLSLNFTVRNNHGSEITLFSLEPELLRFLDGNSAEFRTVERNLPELLGGCSAPIFTHALFVRLSPDHTKCVSGFGSTEDSAGSRGILSPFHRTPDPDNKDVERFTKVFDQLAEFSAKRETTPETGEAKSLTSANCIPSGMRFLLKADESDSFHCQVSGREPGVYFFRLKLSFHYETVKAVRYSDEIYPCFSGFGRR